MFDILSGLGWKFPVISFLTRKPRTLDDIFGEGTTHYGDLRDHQIVYGDPVFRGYNMIDLKRSPRFRMRFAYPVTIQFMWLQEAPMGQRNIVGQQTKVYRKNQVFIWKPEMADAWGAYPGASEIYMIQQSGGE